MAAAIMPIVIPAQVGMQDAAADRQATRYRIPGLARPE